MKTFAHARGSSDGRVYFVALHTSAPPSEESWSTYVKALGVAVGSAVEPISLMVVTDGGAPNAMQRRELAGACERARIPPFAHIYSDDAFVRGVVTAFRWLARARFAAHSPSEFRAICTEANLAHEQVLYDLITLQKTMPAVRTLRLVADAAYPARVQPHD